MVYAWNGFQLLSKNRQLLESVLRIVWDELMTVEESKGKRREGEREREGGREKERGKGEEREGEGGRKRGRERGGGGREGEGGREGGRERGRDTIHTNNDNSNIKCVKD